MTLTTYDDELCKILEPNVCNTKRRIEVLEELQKRGARNVLVSMAGDGAVLLDQDKNIHRCKACSGKVINSVGAGDSMLAGFLAGIDKGVDYALKLATAAGGATAFSKGLAKKDEIFELIKQLD